MPTTTIPPIRRLALICGATFLWTAAVVLAVPDAPCYFPPTGSGDDLAPGYYPCYAYGREVSSCCAPGWTCFSNSLCIATTPSRSWPNITIGAVQRGACTAPKWDNNACGNICLTGDNADGKLAYCGNHRYCCMGDFLSGKCTCTEGGGSFEQDGEALAQTIIQVTDLTFTGRPSPTTATPPASFRPSSESTTTADADTTDTALSTSTTSGIPSSTDPTASPASTSEGSGAGGSTTDDGSGKKKLTIALAVAIPVAVLLIGAVVGWVFYKKHGPNQVAGPAEEMGGVGGQDNGPPYSYDTGLAESHQNGVDYGQNYAAHR